MFAGKLRNRKVLSGTGHAVHGGLRDVFRVPAAFWMAVCERNRLDGAIPVRIRLAADERSDPDRRGINRNARGDPVKRLGLIAVVLLLTSCGWKIGPINYPPAPSGGTMPTEVTVKRVTSIMGLVVPMIFTIDGVDIYGLWTDESYTFMLEPGDYIFGYYLGFNQCRKYIRIERRPSQLIYLGPPCEIRPARSIPPAAIPR